MTKFNKEFFDKFPLLYKDFDYISCDNGWYNLLYDLSEKLENILKHSLTAFITVDQVKSKFGGLRFYITTHDFDNKRQHDVENLIKEAESKSLQICEYCGKDGAIQRGAWIRTICDDCHNIKTIIE